MDCIDTGWRNGWQLQANRLLKAHVMLPVSPDPGLEAALPHKLSPSDCQEEEPEPVFAAGTRSQDALETIARLRGRLSRQRELSQALSDEVARLSAIAEAAEHRADVLAQEFTEVRDRLGAELDSTLQEKNYIAELLLEKSCALDDARNRLGFLEAALSGAETECKALTAETANAVEKQAAHSVDCKRREHEAFAQVADAQQRLARAQQEIHELTAKNTGAEEVIAAVRNACADAVDKTARLEQDLAAYRAREREATMQAAVAAERLARAERELSSLAAKNDAAERRIAAASLARANAAIENSKLEKELAMQRARVAELEQARARPSSALRTLMAARNGRDRSLARGKDDQHLSTDLGSRKVRTREQWTELLQQLNQLMSLKRQEPQQSPALLLANTISYA